jgi:hypothetical protein
LGRTGGPRRGLCCVRMFWVMLEECFVFFAGFKQDSSGFLGDPRGCPRHHPPPSHGLATSLWQRRHAQRPVRWRPRLPSSLPSLSPRRPAGAATPLHHRWSFGHGDLEGAAEREEQGPRRARMRGSDLGRQLERRCFLPPAPLRGPRVRPRARAGRASLLPPARRPIPPSAA